MRWILLLVTVAALALAFRTTSPGLLAVCLLVAAIALFGSMLGFVRERVESVADGQGTREIQLLMAMRGKSAAPAASGRRDSGLLGGGGFGLDQGGERVGDAGQGGDAADGGGGSD